ncbi:hypothetical protein PTMSG1_03952 [Pyrenophora teres f. maculata]|nr:hypothetical protein PTMSG1_03952 [Pyrenophora teres f. maculata]
MKLSMIATTLLMTITPALSLAVPNAQVTPVDLSVITQLPTRVVSLGRLCNATTICRQGLKCNSGIIPGFPTRGICTFVL